MNPHVLYVLHALSPLHVGVDEGLGAIDLPTMRERHTHYPLVPGSSVKGVLREEAEVRFGRESDDVLGAFGPPQTRAGDFRGGIVLTDASVLALPVRSLCGTFAWVCCPHVVRRLRRDLAVTGTTDLPAVPALSSGRGLVPQTEESGQAGSALLVPGAKGSRVFLEDSLLEAEPAASVRALAERFAGWYWPGDADAQGFFKQRFLMVHDDLFGFYTRAGLEVRARVKIDKERGTAAKSGPWTEEHMPAETLLYGLAFGRSTRLVPRPAGREEGREPPPASAPGAPWAPERSLQVLQGLGLDGGVLLRFGGHSTIGLGRARLRVVAGDRGGEG